MIIAFTKMIDPELVIIFILDTHSQLLLFLDYWEDNDSETTINHSICYITHVK